MRLLTGLLVAAFVASGCIGGGTETGFHDRGDERMVVTDGDLPTELARVDDSFPLGDRLRLGLSRPSSYLPSQVALSDQSAVIISDLLFDGLTEAVAETGRLRPALAKSWSANPDFTVWRFELDQSSGVSAEVIVEALAPLADGSRAGGTAAVTAGIRSVVASTDGRTVMIELQSSNAGLPWILSGLPFAVAGSEGESTGDYRVVTDDVNGLVMQRRVRSETSPSDASQLPGLPSEINITWLGQDDDARDLVAEGVVAAAVAEPSAFASLESSVEVVTTSVATRFYVMNANSASLVDPNVRLAVLAAIDRSALTRDGFDQRVAPVDGVVSPSLSGYQAGSCGTTCRFDPARSARMQADAADALGGAGIPLRLTYTGGEEQEATATAILAQLSMAGFQAAGAQLQPDELARVIVAGETDLFAFGWVAPATSLDAVIPPLFSPGSVANIARIASSEVTDLLSRAAVTGDHQRRWGLLEQAHRMALAESLIVPIAASTAALALGPDATGLSIRADGSLDLESTR